MKNALTGIYGDAQVDARLQEFLLLLESEKIEYLLIGGYAVALYGYCRPTKDIDFWVACDEANLHRLQSALIKFGFSPSSVEPPLFKDAQTVLRMGAAPNRLEILSQIAGVDFADCYKRRRVMDVEGLAVTVIDYADLLQNKRSTGRQTELGDVERLERRRKKP